ncbi:MAG TPA: methyltransferase domain-containing protein [Anaerolineales bacterium]|jgi:ubiquinone/menaquinone biosynthesis C-methylase UbiE|nr:methyltransferase domain-containing protein [Anaerolineales bacterium]
MSAQIELPKAVDIKTCCANLYASDWAHLLLGDSFHPGGVALSERLASFLRLGPGRRLLDVASGKGTSAIYLAQRYGCDVVGVDYSQELVAEATEAAQAAGLADRVQFRHSDVETLPFPEAVFDALICECAFCTFPDKATAASGFARVMRVEGRLGLSELTRTGELPEDLEGLLAWVACIGDARPLEEYVTYLKEAGLAIVTAEKHDDAVRELVRDIRTKLLAAEMLVKLKKLDLPGADFEQARGLARSAVEAVRAGKLGYALLVGVKQNMSGKI